MKLDLDDGIHLTIATHTNAHPDDTIAASDDTIAAAATYITKLEEHDGRAALGSKIMTKILSIHSSNFSCKSKSNNS